MNKKKHVCLIGPLPPPMTGLSKALDSILNSPACQEQFEFSVIDLSKIYTVSGGKLSFGKITGLHRLVEQVRQQAESGAVDVFYLTNAQSTVGAIRDMFILHTLGQRKKSAGFRIAVHLHGGSFHNLYLHSNPLLQTLLRRNYAYVDRAVVLGAALRNMFEGLVPDDRITMIPNCVDDSILIDDAAFSAKLTQTESKKSLQILYLSNMIPEKGYMDVLKAAELCLPELPDARFVFAGAFYSQTARSEFAARVSEMNNRFPLFSETAVEKSAIASQTTAEQEPLIFTQTDAAREPSAHMQKDSSQPSSTPASSLSRVCYLGPVTGDAKKQLLAGSDLFVLPTYYPHEGQPITIIEAMSAGMPVICTDHAGIRDLVSDPDNACFVPPQSPEEIARQILRLAGDRVRIRTMALNNRRRVLAHFREKNYIGNIIELLNNV